MNPAQIDEIKLDNKLCCQLKKIAEILENSRYFVNNFKKLRNFWRNAAIISLAAFVTWDDAGGGTLGQLAVEHKPGSTQIQQLRTCSTRFNN